MQHECQGQIDIMEQSPNMMDTDEIKLPSTIGHKRTGSDSRNPTDATDNSESEAEKPIK